MFSSRYILPTFRSEKGEGRLGTGRISHMIHLQGGPTAPSTVACASKRRGAVRPWRQASCDPLLCLLRTPLNEANQHYFPFITSMTSSSASSHPSCCFLLELSRRSSLLLVPPLATTQPLLRAPTVCPACMNAVGCQCSEHMVQKGAGPHHPFTQSFDRMHRCAWAPGQTLDI